MSILTGISEHRVARHSRHQGQPSHHGRPPEERRAPDTPNRRCRRPRLASATTDRRAQSPAPRCGCIPKAPGLGFSAPKSESTYPNVVVAPPTREPCVMLAKTGIRASHPSATAVAVPLLGDSARSGAERPLLPCCTGAARNPCRPCHMAPSGGVQGHSLQTRDSRRRCKRPDAAQAPPSKTDMQTSRAVFAAPWFRKKGI